MRIQHLATMVAASAVTLAAAAPANAIPVNTKYFFQCADAVKVRNTMGAAPWSTAAPTTSFQAGGGCGYADTGFAGVEPGNDTYDAVFEGTHSGDVGSITVELHDLLLSQAESTLLGGVSYTVRLTVDGSTVVDTSDQDPPVESAPTVSSTGLSQSVRFTIQNLPILGDVERNYQLTIGKYYSDTAGAWVFGATEVPAHIEFNPAKAATTKIKAG